MGEFLLFHSTSDRFAFKVALLVQEADEQLKLTVSGVKLHFDGATTTPLDDGCLYVTTRRVIWHSVNDSAVGFAISFRSIGMHAVSRDTSDYPSACMYLQIDTEDDAMLGGDDEDDDEEAVEEEGEGQDSLELVQEVRLVPAGKFPVQTKRVSLYHTPSLCPCQHHCRPSIESRVLQACYVSVSVESGLVLLPIDACFGCCELRGESP